MALSFSSASVVQAARFHPPSAASVPVPVDSGDPGLGVGDQSPSKTRRLSTFVDPSDGKILYNGIDHGALLAKIVQQNESAAANNTLMLQRMDMFCAILAQTSRIVENHGSHLAKMQHTLDDVTGRLHRLEQTDPAPTNLQHLISEAVQSEIQLQPRPLASSPAEFQALISEAVKSELRHHPQPQSYGQPLARAVDPLQAMDPWARAPAPFGGQGAAPSSSPRAQPLHPCVSVASEFVPKKLWLRGWVRWVHNVPDFVGISAETAVGIVQIIEAKLAMHHRSLLGTFPRRFGYKVQSIILNALPSTSKQQLWEIRDAVQKILEENSVTITVKDEKRAVRCTVDKPPWQIAREKLVSVAGDVWESCYKDPSLVLNKDFRQGILWLTSPSEHLLGKVKVGEWAWSKEATDVIPLGTLEAAWAKFE